jgi:hydrazine synthase alpha subunit-like protein/WD40 repeat protein
MNKVVTGSLWASSLLLGALAGCGSGSSSGDSTTLTVAGDVPIAYAQRANTASMNPTTGGSFAPGGDLMIREKSSASALEHNMTAQFTQGRGDVRSPSVSYDGKRIVFAMNCPASNTSQVGGVAACTGAWNIWEYVMTDTTPAGLVSGTFRRLTATGSDDVEPAYLPAGRGFVFTSNRQTISSVNQALGHSYKARDEYERETVFNLHTMDADGGSVTQISFNQSHDRNPTVRQNGDIMFSRWDHVGGRNHFKIFRTKPDGTDMFVLYGAHSEGNSFLHPKDMDPKGKYAGFLTSDLMPLSKTHEGGGLVFIDAANFSEQNSPIAPGITGTGQHQATAQALNLGGGLSKYGRVSSPDPLWDGTDRVLVSFTPCEVSRKGVVVSCQTLSQAEMDRLSMERLNEVAALDDLQANVAPSYAIYMFDPAAQTFLVVAAPPPGMMNMHPVAIQAKTEPNATLPTNVDPTLAAQGLGLLEVRSVYDTDELGRMASGVLSAADAPAGCATQIATTAPTDPADTRSQVADLVKMKDPANPAYGCSPAYFVRAVRAIAPGVGMTGMRQALGETEFEMQQILGYAPIEPDGSFKLTVPADTPIALAVVNSRGEGLQTHTNWIQVRPGERRTCDGCHSPRRGGAINSGTVVNAAPAGIKTALAVAHESGETMAGTRTRLDPTALKLVSDMVYQDFWADTTKPGVTARASVTIKYTGNANPADDLPASIPAPVNGIVNYPTHIAPLWSLNRGANTCTGCHSDPDKLDLSASMSGTGRVESYQDMMLGDPAIDSNGMPVTMIEDGELMIVRGPALVDTMASEGDALGLARKSRIYEILSGRSLMSSADAKAAHPNPPSTAPDHSKMLNKAELRVLAEFIDLGGKYFNDPFDPAANVNQLNGLDEAVFEKDVMPILSKTCASYCHQAVGSSIPGDTTAPKAGTNFHQNRFVLVGDEKGDYGVTLSMISNACNPASNYLLKMPSTVPHPGTLASPQTSAVLPIGSADYNTIANWIKTGC